MKDDYNAMRKKILTYNEKLLGRQSDNEQLCKILFQKWSRLLRTFCKSTIIFLSFSYFLLFT